MKNSLHSFGARSAAFLTLVAVVAVFPFATHTARAVVTSPLSGQIAVGSRGTDVSTLQTFLAADSHVYPAALITGYYGSLTSTAVKQFQVGYGLPPVGRVGPLTLQQVNGVIASGLPLDLTTPVITATAVQLASTTGTIAWNTNEPTTGTLYYSNQPIQVSETNQPFGQPPVSGVAVPITMSGVAQSVQIMGLSHNTTYYYLIVAKDASGNVSVTLPAWFTVGS